jgi:hypothetical protein
MSEHEDNENENLPDSFGTFEFSADDFTDLPFPEGMMSNAETWEDIPEPMRTFIRKISESQVKAKMSEEAEGHAAQRFFDEMDADGLMVLNALFNDIAGEGSRLGAYYQGVVRAILHVKFNVCPSCGVNHEAEALSALTGDDDA